MSGDVYCPKCEKLTSCNCTSCRSKKTQIRRITWNENGETMICHYCGHEFNTDQTLDK